MARKDSSSTREVAILFICTGNICRSPLAATLFNRLVVNSNLAQNNPPAISATSAGIHAVRNAPADPYICTLAAAADADLSDHRARQFDTSDFNFFHHLIALDLYHYDFLTATKPSNAPTSISLLLDHVDHIKEREIPDPYGRSRRVFEQSARLIEEGVRGLLRTLERTYPSIFRGR